MLVEFRPAAAADAERAASWYEGQQPGLGDEFLATLDDAMSSISDNPYQFPAIYRDTRRALLKRFPYGLYFRVLERRVLVVACFHARRDPQGWRQRN